MTMGRAMMFSLLGAAGMGLAAPANAATVLFTGSASATPSVSADPTCAPLPFRGIVTPANSAGTSNFGNFTYSHNACTQGATGPVTGVFALDFAGSLLSGSFEGFSVARDGTPGLFDQTFTYTVTGGTGVFLNALGSFTNVGTVDVRGGPPSRLALNFNGAIDVPAVPEPATWAMLLLGFFGAGGALRIARRRPGVPTVASVGLHPGQLVQRT